ncbi:MAG: hypothetical protein E7313_06565 [Clostridiales bacterium]|nr:hypothetical protein [Clostridiales bacterium]
MQKEKSIGRNILIVVLILVTIASVCAGLFAWAKYQTTINGTATGETAKWSFKVSDGDTSTQEIEFPMTRTDNNTSVAEGKIAPGTYGKLEIGIDATGTETALTYVIEGTTENLPTNLKFYADEDRILDLTVSDNKFSKGGYMKLNEVGVRNEIIYWEWPFETGTTSESIAQNDEIDKQDSLKTMSMKVSVTGKQLNGNPVLADLVQVGDYVDYNPSSNGIKTFTSADWVTGGKVMVDEEEAIISTDEQFNSDAPAQWRVLSVDRNTGNIEIIPVEATQKKVTFTGWDGFVNCNEMLDKVSLIYGQGKGATGGRSMKLEDVEQYSSYVPELYVDTVGYGYGDTKTYSNGNFYIEKYDDNGKFIGYNTEERVASPVTMTQTMYIYAAKNYFNNNTIFKMLFKNLDNSNASYWLASQAVNLDDICCYYGIDIISGERKSISKTFYSSTGGGKTAESEARVMPIVSLNTNIQTSGKDANGVWQLDVE